jgi:hypothetical protein
VATPGSVVGGPSILMAAAAAQEKVKQDAILEDILFKQQQQQQKLAANSMTQELVVPATPSSPASEMTSEWTPFSNSKPKEEGTKPFGKGCPCLKQNVVFQVRCLLLLLLMMLMMLMLNPKYNVFCVFCALTNHSSCLCLL